VAAVAAAEEGGDRRNSPALSFKERRRGERLHAYREACMVN